MLNSIKAWVATKGGWVHVIVGAYFSLIFAYGSVPAFHTLVLSIWGSFPGWTREVGLAVIGMAALYTAPNSPKFSIRKTS